MTRLWVLGSFTTPDAVLAAARSLAEQGHHEVDTYSPIPLEGASEVLDRKGSRLPAVVAAAGFGGAALGILVEAYCDAFDFPIDVGGRPPFSAPSFVPIGFELGVLLGALGAFLGLFAVLGLPRLHHPVFEAPGFVRATVDRYWVSALPRNEDERRALEEALAALGAGDVTVVEGEP